MNSYLKVVLRFISSFFISSQLFSIIGSMVEPTQAEEGEVASNFSVKFNFDVICRLSSSSFGTPISSWSISWLVACLFLLPSLMVAYLPFLLSYPASSSSFLMVVAYSLPIKGMNDIRFRSFRQQKFKKEGKDETSLSQKKFAVN